MTNSFLYDMLCESLKLCSIHYERMTYASKKIQDKFPLDSQIYANLSYDDLSYIDQLIFRFSKLQDSMGNRLFHALLQNLGEDSRGKPFIDILLRLEELRLLDDHNEWLRLRETRNTVTHEYPFAADEIIEGLNVLYSDVSVLNEIWHHLKNYCKEKFGITCM